MGDSDYNPESKNRTKIRYCGADIRNSIDFLEVFSIKRQGWKYL